MAGPQKSHLDKPTGDGWDRRITKMTLSLYPRDLELLNWISEYLGCSQSEAFRTAIRVAASALPNVSKSGATTP